ncbi:response regulator [Rhodococcus sp. LB1]|uniref:response regulator n=1 Tax=Rhodococcus sp. LB1 TaxID=1807499 RepID=UPI00077AD5EB|nr:response regulator transcription factor [Rhodococcus sp. LB1]KXX59542.1 DNA-binding response regulator [Rhodococcus sp. LB1]
MSEITVFIVDDHALVRHGLRAFLQTQKDVTVVGEAENGKQAVHELRARGTTQTLPDVVLMDLVMPELDGVGAISTLHTELPDLKIVALSSFSETERVHAALQAGATGYLLKNSDPEEISAAIRSAQRDQVHLDPAVARVLARSMRTSPATALSAREREVLALVAQGNSNQEIADALFISERTARTHVSHIISKLGLSSRIQAALWAIKQGIVTIS